LCLALYPFTTSFPAEHVVRDAENALLAQIETVDDIDALQASISAGGPPSELVARFKLRRVLVLHDGTNAGIQDLAVARVNSITPEKQAKERWYRRVSEGTHATALLIGHDERHGSNGREQYVDLTSIAVVPKNTILRRVGALNADEMKAVATRIKNALELDL
jgi:hypothetical protein